MVSKLEPQDTSMGEIVQKLIYRITPVVPVRVLGRVRAVTGLIVRASVPDATMGELVEIERRDGALAAQVVGFDEEGTLLMPFGTLTGIGPHSTVRATGRAMNIACGEALLGRILNGLGQPIDKGGPLDTQHVRPWSIQRPAPDPLKRPPITKPFETGVRAIDGTMMLGQGQRVGLFAGSGVGKSTLLGQIARQSNAEITVVCLVGERGRELRAFLENNLRPEHLKRTVVVCATSDQPSLVRLNAAQVATAIAEYFRDQGAHVLLLMDSVTRYARALRDVGLAAGEPPVRRGYPPSVFSALPALLERAGSNAKGSMTAIYSVLVEGSDMDEPIADELRATLDGHIILSRTLAERAHWPAIDVRASLSRLMRRVAEDDHIRAGEELRQCLAVYEKNRTVVRMGAYKRGTDRDLDFALDSMQDIERFLRQDPDEHTPLHETIDELLHLFG